MGKQRGKAHEGSDDIMIPRAYQGEPVVVLGDALIDYIYEVEEMPPPGGDAVIHSSCRRPGGAGLNTSIGLAALGVSCFLVTTVGDDDEGVYLRRCLETAGVDASCVRSEGTTGFVLSFADSNGERTMFSCRGAASSPVEIAPQVEAALARTPLLLVSGYCLLDSEQAGTCLEAVEVVEGAGGIVAFDPTPAVAKVLRPALEAILGTVDVVLANLAELQVLSGCERLEQGMRAVLRRVPCLGLKLGPRGSIVALGPRAAESRIAHASGLDKAALEPAFITCHTRPVEAADTTGAGDAFNAGFIAALLHTMSPSAWGKWGNEMAMRTCIRGRSPSQRDWAPLG